MWERVWNERVDLMPRIKGCSIEGSQVLCTVCPFKDDVIGCQEYCRMYGADEVWSDDC